MPNEVPQELLAWLREHRSAIVVPLDMLLDGYTDGHRYSRRPEVPGKNLPAVDGYLGYFEAGAVGETQSLYVLDQGVWLPIPGPGGDSVCHGYPCISLPVGGWILGDGVAVAKEITGTTTWAAMVAETDVDSYAYVTVPLPANWHTDDDVIVDIWWIPQQTGEEDDYWRLWFEVDAVGVGEATAEPASEQGENVPLNYEALGKLLKVQVTIAGTDLNADDKLAVKFGREGTDSPDVYPGIVYFPLIEFYVE